MMLTAWHVVSGQRHGEELDIYTLYGQRHRLGQDSLKRLGQVDTAIRDDLLRAVFQDKFCQRFRNRPLSMDETVRNTFYDFAE